MAKRGGRLTRALLARLWRSLKGPRSQVIVMERDGSVTCSRSHN